MKKYIGLFVKGLIIGAAMLIPGVSGGTTAILLGVYDKIISAVSELFSDLKNNLSFLKQCCLEYVFHLLLKKMLCLENKMVLLR